MCHSRWWSTWPGSWGYRWQSGRLPTVERVGKSGCSSSTPDLVANLGLPVYYRRYRPAEFSGLRHAVLPLLGVAAIAFPLYELVKPGQPAPYTASR